MTVGGVLEKGRICSWFDMRGLVMLSTNSGQECVCACRWYTCTCVCICVCVCVCECLQLLNRLLALKNEMS